MRVFLVALLAQAFLCPSKAADGSHTQSGNAASSPYAAAVRLQGAVKINTCDNGRNYNNQLLVDRYNNCSPVSLITGIRDSTAKLFSCLLSTGQGTLAFVDPKARAYCESTITDVNAPDIFAKSILDGAALVVRFHWDLSLKGLALGDKPLHDAANTAKQGAKWATIEALRAGHAAMTWVSPDAQLSPKERQQKQAYDARMRQEIARQSQAMQSNKPNPFMKFLADVNDVSRTFNNEGLRRQNDAINPIVDGVVEAAKPWMHKAELVFRGSDALHKEALQKSDDALRWSFEQMSPAKKSAQGGYCAYMALCREAALVKQAEAADPRVFRDNADLVWNVVSSFMFTMLKDVVDGVNDAACHRRGRVLRPVVCKFGTPGCTDTRRCTLASEYIKRHSQLDEAAILKTLMPDMVTYTASNGKKVTFPSICEKDREDREVCTDPAPGLLHECDAGNFCGEVQRLTASFAGYGVGFALPGMVLSYFRGGAAYMTKTAPALRRSKMFAKAAETTRIAYKVDLVPSKVFGWYARGPLAVATRIPILGHLLKLQSGAQLALEQYVDVRGVQRAGRMATKHKWVGTQLSIEMPELNSSTGAIKTFDDALRELGFAPGSSPSQAEIAKRFRKLAAEFHVDKTLQIALRQGIVMPNKPEPTASEAQLAAYDAAMDDFLRRTKELGEFLTERMKRLGEAREFLDRAMRDSRG